LELKRIHWFGIISGVVIIMLSFFLIGTSLFFFVIWFGVIIAVLPFVITTVRKTKEATEKEELFLEFTRNLVESVRTGTPISKSIVNMKKKSFGVLSKHIEKLANQISMGIPLTTALNVFAKDVDNETVSRTITLIGEAEKSGGSIGEILESVAKAVNMSDKLKKERKASISTLVVQGYIIFFIFLIIIIVMQYYIIPMISGIANVGSIGGLTGGAAAAAPKSATSNMAAEISKSFIYLLIAQGFFTGLTIGKLSEGNIKAGIRHSFSLIVLAFVVSTVASLLFGK
jgi:archaeal flagellar protein FlaJ